MSGGNPPPAPASWQMPNQTPAANNAFGAIKGLSDMPNFGTPAAYGAADVAGGSTGWNPQTTVGYGNNISQLSSQYLPYAQQIMQMGFDPNGDYYARAAHDVQEQQRVAQGVRGIATSPYGAQLENDAMRNFNIDWRNTAVNRAAAAAGAALPFWQTAGNQMQQGQQTAMLAPQTQMGLYGSQSQIGQGAYMHPNDVINSWLNYVGQGNSANSVANQSYANQLQAWQAKQQADNAIWSDLATGVGAAAGMAMHSDPDLKENIEPVYDEAIIRAFANLPTYAYNYTAQSGLDGEQRIGPMATDWADTFGGDRRVIPVPQMVGAALAALSALSRKVDRLAA